MDAPSRALFDHFAERFAAYGAQTPVTSSPLVAGFLSNLPAYRIGVSPLLRGVEIGLVHGLLVTGEPLEGSAPAQQQTAAWVMQNTHLAMSAMQLGKPLVSCGVLTSLCTHSKRDRQNQVF